jgi:biopolymer transport protein ExbB
MSLPVLDVVNQLMLTATEPVMSFDLMSMWRSMGPFAKFIGIVLAIMSVWSLAVAVELKEAVELAHSKEYSKGYLARVLGMGLEEYRHGLESHQAHGGEHEIGKFDIVAAVNRAIDRGTLRTITDMRRGLGSLATIGSTAPFVGLLGTVAGIITAFQAMAATGSGGLGSPASPRRS